MRKRIRISEVERQGAIDWAHSVQARQAEKMMGEIARRDTGGPGEPEYRAKLAQVAREAGFDEETIARNFKLPKFKKRSEFDEPDVRFVTSDQVTRLLKTMAKAKMTTGGRRLMISSLASGQVNALCATNSWDEKHYHIFVDADLTTFCNSIGKLFAECLMRGNTVPGSVSLAPMALIRNFARPEMQNRVADLFGACVLKGTARASKPWAPSAQMLDYTVVLSSWLTMFPIAHELAHLHLGHLSSEHKSEVAVDEMEDLVATIYSKEDEFAADAEGAILCLRTASRLEVSDIVIALGPYIFLKSIETLDTCFAIFGGRAGEMSFTHPSASERAEKLPEIICDYLRSRGEDEHLSQAIKAVDQISLWISSTATKHLSRLKTAGQSPRERLRLRVVENGGDVRILGMFPSTLPDPGE